MDPQGARTIAVVTKLDIIDNKILQKTQKLLTGQRTEVKSCIVGVVNRSEQDVRDNKTMEESIESEKLFLLKNYPDIYKKHGTTVLANKLQSILINHIKETFPILYKNLNDIKTKLENQLKSLKLPKDNISFTLDLLKDISKFY